jgi:hypothetical protein
MKIRPLAVFVADFPDDAVVDDNDYIVIASGRGIADAISSMLRKAGYELTEPEHEPEHGWTFYAKGEKTKMWFQVQDIVTECYLSTENMMPFKFRRSVKQAYVAFMKTLNAGLNADPRFRNVLWHTRMNPPGEVGVSDPLIEP